MNIRPVRREARCVLAMLLATAAIACDSPGGPEPSLPALGRQNSFIVNGTLETGWPAIGALTASMQGYYIGEFCTGTLIAPQWVLTAAHCVTPTDEFPVTHEMTRFFIGNDALPTGSQQNPQPPTTGTFYQADAFYPHPDYATSETGETDNDIALVHLAKAVANVAPAALNAKGMDGSFLNQTVAYVGFGATEGVNSTGSGVKRSGTMKLITIQRHDYVSQYGGQGVCFGDSGGPGLLQIEGVWKVIGVNSTVGNDGQDPCRGIANHTRVDIYVPWINEYLSLPPPDCRKTGQECECAEACSQLDGTCNNDVCRNFDCQAVYDCIVNCGNSDETCQQTCYNRGTQDAQSAFMGMMQCFQDRCGNVSDSQFQQCAYQNCGTEINTCFPGVTGDRTCEQAYDCMVECSGDRNCINECWDSGTTQAQTLLNAVFQCFQVQCGSLTDETAYRECAWTKCESQLVACMPPDECSMLGGDCAVGLACWRALGAHTDCRASSGKPEGEPCLKIAGSTGVPCGDGLACVQDGGGYFCRQVCVSGTECASGAACVSPLVEGWEGWGYCPYVACIDADQDGTCAPTDCDDGDGAVHPGAAEACGNGVDDDCNGQTDEGCAACTDADQDGRCEDVDCDDADPAVHPDAAERCGNGVDDDCDGQTDEDCQDCTDEDADGYCADVDCDDGDEYAFPGANEYCGNRMDDDCDGQVDEGCEACTDVDGDGFCTDADCDDGDASVHPGAAETCDNGIDDNCSGTIDEGCDTCVGEACPPAVNPVASKGGGCASGPARSGEALPVILMAGLLLGLRRVRRPVA